MNKEITEELVLRGEGILGQTKEMTLNGTDIRVLS